MPTIHSTPTRAEASMPSRSLRRASAPRSRWAALGLAVLVAGAAAGCKSEATTGSLAAQDYRVRHPIALTYAPTTLDVFLSRNMVGVDARQTADLRTFAADYRKNGRGPLTILAPRDPTAPAASDRAAASVRSVLAGAGVSGRYVQVQSYPGNGDSLANPIRLVFSKLQAKVATQCGTWNDDLGESPQAKSWRNQQHYDFGCSYQTALANQVADPIDLQRGRNEDRADVLRRMKVFDDARKGVDPSTSWKTEQAKVTGSGGN